MSLTGQDISAVFKKHPISLSGAVVALLFGFATYYRSADVPATEAVLDQRTAEGERLKNNIRYSALLDDQLAAIEAAAGEMQQRAIRPAERATNYQYFYKMEADTGVKLLDLRQMDPVATGGTARSPKAAAPKTIYAGVPYSVAVQGTYAQVFSFLRRLEGGMHFCRILNASIGQARSEGGTTAASLEAPLVTASLTLELLGTP